MSSVISTVGIPPGGIALLMSVGRILDMSCTSLNVAGDVVACLGMDKWIGSRSSDEEARQQSRDQVAHFTSNEDVIVK